MYTVIDNILDKIWPYDIVYTVIYVTLISFTENGHYSTVIQDISLSLFISFLLNPYRWTSKNKIFRRWKKCLNIYYFLIVNMYRYSFLIKTDIFLNDKQVFLYI